MGIPNWTPYGMKCGVIKCESQHEPWQAWTSRSPCAPPFGLCSWPARTPVAQAVPGRSMAMPIAPRSWTTSGPGCVFWTRIITGPSGGKPSVTRRGMRLSRSPSSSPNWMCVWCCACWLKRSEKVPERTVPLITPRDGAWMLIKTGSHTHPHTHICVCVCVLGFHMVIIYGFILLGKIHWTNITSICLCRGLGHRPVIDRPRIVRFICSMSVCMTIFININYVEPTSTNGRNRSRPKYVSESVLFFFVRQAVRQGTTCIIWPTFALPSAIWMVPSP